MLLSITSTTAKFSVLTTFLVNLLLQNLTLNPHIRTIAVYHDNQLSSEFINCIIERLSDFQKPIILIELHNIQHTDSSVIGHEIIHLFLWNDISIDLQLWKGIALIQNSESVFYIFEQPQEKPDMDTLSQSLWNLEPRKLYGSIVVFQDKATKKPDMVTYCPFKRNLLLYENFTHLLEEKLYGGVLNAERINMRGYNISVLLILRPPTVVQIDPAREQFGGRDGKMAAFLAEYYNAAFHYVKQATTAVLVLHQEGDRNVSSYVPVDAVQDDDVFVVDDEVRPMKLNVSTDIMMNSLVCCDIANNYMHFYPHEFDSFVVVVPSASVNRHLRHIFHPTVYSYEFYAFLLFSAIWMTFKYILYKKETIDYDHVCVEVLGIVLQTKASKDTKFFSERILIAFFLLFATVMSIIEAGIIYDEMVKVIDHAEINTLHQLAQSDYQILIAADSRIYMEFGEIEAKLQEKFVLSDTNAIIYNILSKNMSQGYIMRKSRAESVLKRYALWKNGRCIFHIVKESLMPSCQSYYARYTFPFADDFNQIVQRSIEYGFLQHFDRISKYNLYFMDNYKKEIDDDLQRQSKGIDIPELMSSLMIFVIGITAGCVTFILELTWVRIQPKTIEWIELRKKIDLVKVIEGQNQGFISENLYEFVK